MIPISKPSIGKEEENAVLSVMRSGIIAQGPKVKEFEELFAKFCGTKYALATTSGTTALHLALLAHGIGPGDEVITTPFSFIATANSITFTGAKAVFVDVAEDDFNIDPKLIESKITKNTKAIMPVHLYGNPAKMDEIMLIAKKHNLVVIEDACQAHGAEVFGKKVGSFGTGCFSFYPTKNMASGEGGMLTTNDERVYHLAKMLREHGSKVRYVHEMVGYNFRMTDLHAAIGVEQLKKLDDFTKKRIANAKKLNSGLRGVITPVIRKDTTHVFHQYTIKAPRREELIKHLEENGIGYGIYYPTPIHKQKAYLDLGYNVHLPVAEKLAKEALSIPVNPMLSQEDVDAVIEAINEFYSK